MVSRNTPDGIRDAVRETISMQKRGASASMGDNPLAGPVYTGAPKLPAKCATCDRDPAKMNSEIAECSHTDCPHRGKAWSDRPTRAKYFKGPWPKNADADPRPIDAPLTSLQLAELDRYGMVIDRSPA